MEFSKWQYIKQDKNGLPYMTIHRQRYYLHHESTDIHATRPMLRGVQFHGVTWCGYYYIQYEAGRDPSKVRYVRVA